MEHFTYKIRIPDNITFDEVVNDRHHGAKFVFFGYLIPRPIFSPIKRISKVYYLKPNENASQYSTKYNFITMLWGWWGLPFGPGATYSTIKSNKTGIDITNDVYDNLTKEDFEYKRVVIKKITSIFTHPDKSSIKELTKCFKKYSQSNSFVQNPIVGYYIDTKEPRYFIGLDSSDMDKMDSLTKMIYKYFYSHSKFEFVALNDSDEFVEKLKTQGVEINCC